ncbi:MAG: hypothetical protein E4H13_09780, partial [Calditrichales bacterium]
SLLLEMFIERWSKPWYNYCVENNLEWTGHYWEHGWPDPAHCIDNMALYAWHQVPAIDILMNQYREDVNAQFGNVRAVKEVISAANQMGRTRTLSETYGAGGWDLRFADMKRIADWEYVLGVNFINPHLSYMTIAGARKRDHPQSFSYHEPWWENHKVMGDYFSRLSLALSAGKQVNHILVLEPTTTAWMYFSPENTSTLYSQLGPLFQNFVLDLEKHQVEYDLGSENIIANNGKIDKNRFVVGHRAYDLVVLPPGMQNLDKRTFDLMDTYLQNGGKILSFTEMISFVDGRTSEGLKNLKQRYEKQWIHATTISDQNVLQALTSPRIQFDHAEMVKGKLFHHRRELSDGQLIFLVNTDDREWTQGSLRAAGLSVTELDALNGSEKAYPWENMDGQVHIKFELPPAGSILLYVSEKKSTPPEQQAPPLVKIISPASDLKIHREALNVLTLDFCDLELAGKTEADIYFYQAADKIYKHHGLDGNPWSEAVQYKSDILDKDHFDAQSGFIATYSFTVDPGVDFASLQLVVERPERWKIQVNDQPVPPEAERFWLDRAFGVFMIGDKVKTGENRVRLIGQPMTIHSELEPVYLLGAFGLAAVEKGWKLIPESKMRLGSWDQQGLPFYSDAVSYSRTYRVKPENRRHIVKLTDWYGALATVSVNQNPAGIIAWEPAELDITKFVKEGDNEISVTVFGTLKNLLGPHHNGPVRGAAWPSSFQTAPLHQPSGIDYDFISYGLNRDFILLSSEGPSRRVYYKTYQTAAPVIEPQTSLGMDQAVRVTLSCPTDGAVIRYTVDGTQPATNSAVYKGPFELEKRTEVKAQAYKEGLQASVVATQSYYILDSEKNGMTYRYYEGKWEYLPDFASLIAVTTGRCYDFDPDPLLRRGSSFALVFDGFLEVETAGEFTFYLNSNDGSRLMVKQSEVVSNDGLHGNKEMQGKIYLETGLHPFRLEYFDAGGSHSLDVSYQGPGIKKQKVPADRILFQQTR